MPIWASSARRAARRSASSWSPGNAELNDWATRLTDARIRKGYDVGHEASPLRAESQWYPSSMPPARLAQTEWRNGRLSQPFRHAPAGFAQLLSYCTSCGSPYRKSSITTTS
jgi:hypothetical protein